MNREWTGEMTPQLLRVNLHVNGIERGTAFYRALLGIEGERLSAGQHRFPLGGVELICLDPMLEGPPGYPQPAGDYLFIAVDDLGATFERMRVSSGQLLAGIDEHYPGEMSFLMKDPFGNPLCVVGK
jgi:predicted enzyme related to lactoylglutathione lyase